MMPPLSLAVSAVLLPLLCLSAIGGDFSGDEDFDAAWRPERWVFSSGPEFPGAKGSFERSPQAAHQGRYGGRLAFDFSGGGNYVGATLQSDAAPDLAALRLWLKKPAGNSLTLRYTDQTGQTLQKGFWAPDDRWVDVLVPLTGWTGHWGGNDDGTIHGPPKSIGLLVENDGEPRGALLFDELRLLPGTPGDDTSTVTSDYLAAGFTPDEQWHLRARGHAGSSQLRGRRLDFDFTRGAESIGIGPRDSSLLGNPREIRIRVRGSAPGHPVRMQIATHFMTFEKVIGEFDGGKTSEIVVPAPPAEGWKWYGGENDGKRHGPLRIRGIYLDANGRKDSGSLELEEIRVQATCPLNRCCVLMAEHRESPSGGAFVALVRSMAPESPAATLRHTIRDWSGQVVATGSSELTLPPNGQAAETPVAVPAGEWAFLEADFVLDAQGQLVPSAQAYYTAPPVKQADNRLNHASPFGMGLYLYRYGGDAAGLATMDRAAQMAAEAGVKWSREEFSWARIEVAPGKYDWSFYDQVVATAKRHGISVYGLLAYWSGWTKPYTAEGIEDYCRFATAAVTRYRDDVQDWEVYNEPNIFFWQGPRDMYADLLIKAHAAIKKANPNARVLGCSTAGIDLDFIRRTMELGAPFDVLTIHPYRSRMDDRRFIADLREAADVAKQADGTLRPVWITEMGWATHVLHNGSAQGFRVTTQRDQACLIARSYIDAIASGVTPNISWYDFRNDGTDPFNFEHNMGIVSRDFHPKPAYRAYATVATMLDGLHVDREVKLGEHVLAYRFTADEGKSPVLAVWSTAGEQSIELPATRDVLLVDLMGNRTMLELTDGTVGVALHSDTPVFLLVEVEAPVVEHPELNILTE